MRSAVVRMSIAAVLVCLLVAASSVAAQSGGVPVQIGQNVTGTVSAEAPVVRFTLAAAGGETAEIQVLALSGDLLPHLRVLNPAGVEILVVGSGSGQKVIAGNAAFGSAGTYTLEITGEQGSIGDFVLALQAGAPLPQATTLVLNQPMNATAGGHTPVQVYQFDTTSLGATTITVQNAAGGTGALVMLYDEGAGKAIASSDGSVVGAAYALPAGGGRYRVEVRAGASGDTAFTICLGNCGSSPQAGNGAALPTDVPPQVATTTTLAGCTAMSSAGGAANLRSGPGTVYAILGGLPVGQVAQVLGVWTGGSWYQVSYNGQILWVSGAVVAFSGDCSALPLLAAPANAPLAPTATPTASPIPAATATPLPTATPTDVPMLPDLAVLGMTITQDSPTHARVTFDVYNRGTVDVTQPFYVYVCITALCVEKQVTLSVRAGSATNVFVDLNHPSSAVPETVAVAVDSRGEIAELREDNNTTSLADVSLNF